MNAIIVAVAGLALYYLGWRFYSKYVATRIYRLDPDFETPAHELQDGVDYVPTNKHVLWGHHFTSVAGAAPIIGPAIAAFWGWLPALLWILIGTVFFAGVHDFGTLWISVRHKGRSIGSLTERIIGPRSRTLFLIVIFLLLLMVNAVFAIAIAGLFTKFPGSVVPIWVEVPLAIGVGYWIHKRKGGVLWPSLAALAVMYVFVWFGAQMPVELPESTLGLPPAAFWVVILFAYTFIASRLPVWVLLQPRDYINSHQLIIGLLVLFGGLFIGAPEIVAPAINANTSGAPPIVPILFITIACGAISGFHGLVSSGTTSKQLDKETDARFVGYMGSIGEGTLALGAVLAVTAGLAATQSEWAGTYYTDWKAAQGGAVGFFVQGLANLASNLGIPLAVGQVFASVVVVSFAATTMDTGVRLQRYIISEVGQTFDFKILKNSYVATGIAVGSCLALAFGAQGPRGIGSGGLVIWPLFGTTNQLLAGLSLIVITLFLRRLGRNPWLTLVPMSFLLVMTIWAMLQKVGEWLLSDEPNYLLGILAVLVLGSAIWMAIEAVLALRKPEPDATDGVGTA